MVKYAAYFPSQTTAYLRNPVDLAGLADAVNKCVRTG